MEFSRQEYRSGLPFPTPGDLPNPGIEPMSSALQADFFLPLHHLGRECEVSVEVCEVILFKSNWVLQQIVFSQSGPTNITPSHMPLF